MHMLRVNRKRLDIVLNVGISFSLHTILFFLLAQAKLASAVGTRNGSGLTNGRITAKVACTGK